MTYRLHPLNGVVQPSIHQDEEASIMLVYRLLIQHEFHCEAMTVLLSARSNGTFNVTPLKL